ncbi:MAG: (2Fe-2S)-binding protein [Burkholderiales bacterium]|nr:(2Fe-2S)-binding protein [Burkholderiales bacterium]
MRRRAFLGLCAASAAAAGARGLAAADVSPSHYGRARLVDAQGAPLKAAALPVDRNLIFHYPFSTTPCFLLKLGRPAKPSARLATADKRAYEWPGGVGPGRAIVAYSAICAHQLAYPTREISFISYRTEKSARNRHANVIHCCAEHSQYDPAEGARVLAGPAPQPLAAILLEHDAASDGLTAIGTLGGELFNQFFAKYERKLAIEGAPARVPVTATCTVIELENYCRQQVRC